MIPLIVVAEIISSAAVPEVLIVSRRVCNKSFVNGKKIV